MWKHKNFINLQLHAPEAVVIYVNGESVEVYCNFSSIGATGTWTANAHINDKYTIDGNTVVWNDGTILQYNSVDVLPTDKIIVGAAYTTRASSGGAAL